MLVLSYFSCRKKAAHDYICRLQLLVQSKRDEEIARCKWVDKWRCDGYINCPNLLSNDESNCTNNCPSHLPKRCNCNKPGNMTCSNGYICYSDQGKVMKRFRLQRFVFFFVSLQRLTTSNNIGAISLRLKPSIYSAGLSYYDITSQ